MPSAQWYLRRLSFMSPAEIWWRAGGVVQTWTDRFIAPLRAEPVSLDRLSDTDCAGDTALPRICGQLPLPADHLAQIPEAAGWRTALIARAEKICQNQLSFLSVAECPGEGALNWNYEYEAQRPAPDGFSAAINYRDYGVTGDAKLVWELNRHHHLVVLGRAYRVTGNKEYARTIVEHLDSWMQQCPFGRGMNWRSPLELAVRLINWIWALELIRPELWPSNAFRENLLSTVYRHLWDISRKYSRYSSVGNHLIGEAAGVFIGSSYFPGLRHARSWNQEARAILMREMDTQTNEDGGHRELSVGYHLFTLEFLLAAGLVARHSGCDFPAPYWSRLEKMFEFVATLAEGGDELPMLGDCDDGCVLDLGRPADRVQSLLAIGAALWNRSDFKKLAAGSHEAVIWTLGNDGCSQLDRIDEDAWHGCLLSKSFPGTGYHVLQYGHAGCHDRVNVVFDCGELGLSPLAGHGHADALSFTVRVGGVPVLVDPGTYDYFRYPAWREYFRSTRAHNTVLVDDCDQSVMTGRFLWGVRARARCLSFEAGDRGGKVVGEHDGYARLRSPVIHRRSLELDGVERRLTVLDELLTKGQHKVELFFHFAPRCRVLSHAANTLSLEVDSAQITMHLDTRLEIRILKGSETPIAGWVSDAYHKKTPAITLSARGRLDGNTAFESVICFGDAA